MAVGAIAVQMTTETMHMLGQTGLRAERAQIEAVSAVTEGAFWVDPGGCPAVANTQASLVPIR